MIKKAGYIALHAMRKWTSNPRYLVLLLMVSIFIWDGFSPLILFSRSVEVRTHLLLFPFFAGDPVKQLLLMAGVIFLFADAPFMNNNQPYVMIRSGRYAWALGQVFYILLASALYFAVFMGISMLILLPRGTFNLEGWGKIVQTLAQTDAIDQIGLSFGIPMRIVNLYTPIQAFFLCFILEWLAASFLGLVMFVVNMVWDKSIGAFVAIMITLFDLLIVNMFPLSMNYFSPVSLARLSVLDPTQTFIMPSARYGVCCLSVSCLILCVLAVLSVRKRTITITPEL